MSLTVVKIAGKQFLVSPNDRISVAADLGQAGSELTFPEVLLHSDGDQLSVGTPTVANLSVVTKIISSGLGEKLDVYKFKAKSRYRRHIGFRPGETILEIIRINTGEAAAQKIVDQTKNRKSRPVKK